MIGFRIDQAKGLFFDRQVVLDATTKTERQALSKFGAFVRTRAQTSLRRRKKASRPGRPPSSHVGLLKSKLFFAFDPSAHSVVIGPARLNGTTSQRRLDPKSKTVPELLEHGGPARLSLFDPGGGRRATRSIFVQPRPFMQPAFDAELPNAADLWRDSLKAG